MVPSQLSQCPGLRGGEERRPAKAASRGHPAKIVAPIAAYGEERGANDTSMELLMLPVHRRVRATTSFCEVVPQVVLVRCASGHAQGAPLPSSTASGSTVDSARQIARSPSSSHWR